MIVLMSVKKKKKKVSSYSKILTFNNVTRKVFTNNNTRRLPNFETDVSAEHRNMVNNM